MPSSKSVRVSGPAKRDLERIGEYTRREWGAGQKRKYLDQLRNALASLRDRPGIGAPRNEIDKGLRAYPVGRHIIFYRETEDALLIVRVLHQSMDPEFHL